MNKPNKRERKVLEEFALFPEPWERFSGAGTGTRDSLLKKGWIRKNTNPDFPENYYEITDAGKAAAGL